MASRSFDDLQVYQLAERLADRIWFKVIQWPSLARDTVGKQIIRCADSIGANIAEGTGRGSFQDNRRFVRIARGSLYETRHWLRRAFRRQLLDEATIEELKLILSILGPKLNSYLKSIGPNDPGKGSPKANDQ